VPDGLLEKSFAEYDFFAPDTRNEFGQMLKQLANKFNVTMSCLLMRVLRLVEAEHLKLPTNFIIFMIHQSVDKGTSRLGKKSLRVAIPIFPAKLGQHILRRPFQGIAVENLGSEIGRVLTGNKTQGAMRVPLSLYIRQGTSQYQRTTRVFDGRWTTFGGKKLLDGGTALVWGTLN
jgi:hypothetical protein